MRSLTLLLLLALPARALAQASPPPSTVSPPPPPSYPPSYPPEPPPATGPEAPPAQPQPNLQPNLQPYGQPPPNLRPYAPLSPPEEKAKEGPPELVLASGEFFASMAVTVVSTVGVAALLLNPTYAAAGELVLLLYLSVVPLVSSLPVWLISLLSDRYDTRMGPPIEAGSTVSGVALLLGLVGLVANSTTFVYLGAGMLVLGMPLAEVLALNLTKVPKGTGYYGQVEPPWEPPPSRLAELASPAVEPRTVLVGLPALRF